MMGSFSIWHWLVVLLIIILVFGTKKLGNIGKDLGSAIKNFKEGLREEENPADQTIEHQAPEKDKPHV